MVSSLQSLSLSMVLKRANKALHRTAILLRSIAASEFGRWAHKRRKEHGLAEAQTRSAVR